MIAESDGLREPLDSCYNNFSVKRAKPKHQQIFDALSRDIAAAATRPVRNFRAKRHWSSAFRYRELQLDAR